MTTAEAMALAVLKGDMVAARALADHLVETAPYSTAMLPPARRLTTADANRLRVAVFMKDNVDMDRDAQRFLNRALMDWLLGQEPGQSRPFISLSGIERIEIYELPEKP